MFSYYGSKSKVIKYYPKPKCDLIIEPFAGSARYALEYADREVILVEKFHKVAQIWKYLIEAKKSDILALPNMDEVNADLRNYNTLTDVEKWLIGFCLGRGSARPRNTCGQFNSWTKDKIRISDTVDLIKHWKIVEGDYRTLENYKATWFIDPPYQVQKHGYSVQIDNYEELSNWIKSRKGQVIACENEGCTWLEVSPLVIQNGINKKTMEHIYYKENGL